MSISETVRGFASSLGAHPSREQWEALETYAKLVKEWNRTMNLVRYRNEEELWTRHILESLILLPHVRETSLVDLGAGAGFVSIPLCVCSPGFAVLGIESAHKRCVFLARVIRELGLPYQLIRDRLERWLPQHIPPDTLLVARALPAWRRVLPPLLNACPGATRFALFTGEAAVGDGSPLGPGWRAESVHPIPRKTSSSAVLFSRVSRET